MLDRLHHTLPSRWYHDPAHFALEQRAIWQREWLCVGRETEWPSPGDFRVIRVGDQQVIVTRNDCGELRAFHNTCRHRGSQLCAGESGRFTGQRIVCRYHAWTYSLDGQLLQAPRRAVLEGFAEADYPLYGVALQTWGGFVFLNLCAAPEQGFADFLGTEAAAVQAWPLASLVVAHRESHEVACNWKVFWENFSECYHCPGVHPALCRLVPIYGEGLNGPEDLPGGEAGRGSGLLAPGAVTWSDDGQTPLPWLEGLSPAQQAAGMTFCTLHPSMFLIAHVDHVRSVRVEALAPERTRLTVDWMLSPQTLRSGPDLERLTRFARRVVLEDAAACELNQRGLHSSRHQQGVLMPQEYGVLAFGEWVRQRLARAGEAAFSGVPPACA